MCLLLSHKSRKKWNKKGQKEKGKCFFSKKKKEKVFYGKKREEMLIYIYVYSIITYRSWFFFRRKKMCLL